MSDTVKVIKSFYTSALGQLEGEAAGYILAEDFNNLIPFDSDKWHKLVKYTHADYCPVRKNVLMRVIHRVLELMPFWTGTWPCECFDDTFRFDIEYKVMRGYVEIEFEFYDNNMTYIARKEQILTQVWENPENSGKWVCSSSKGELIAVHKRKPIIKGICVNSPPDEDGEPLYLIKHH